MYAYMYVCMYVSAAYVYYVYYVYVAICMNVCTVYTPPIWKNGYAEYRSLNQIQFNSIRAMTRSTPGSGSECCCKNNARYEK